MSRSLISLHAALMNGTEPTFDGQPLPPGLHFRWSFAPELGFPPGGFRLCRKPSRTRGDCLEMPESFLWESEVEPCVPVGTVGPVWGEPDWEEWQILAPPFVLPVTIAEWPARYAGAPAPGDPNVVELDLEEAQRRLGAAQLEPGGDNAGHLLELRRTLAALVGDFPRTPLFNRMLDASPDPSAPRFGVSLMDQLLMSALHPHLAKVLGLYGVVPANLAAEPFDYCLVGRWGDTSCAPRVVTPGLASGRALASGSASIAGVSISVLPVLGRMSGVPRAQGGRLFEEAVAGLSEAEAPAALLVCTLVSGSGATGFRFSFPPAAEVEIQMAGAATVMAFNSGSKLAETFHGSERLTRLTLRAPQPERELFNELVFFGGAPPLLLGQLRFFRLPRGPIGTQAAFFPEPRFGLAPAAPAQPALTPAGQQSQIGDAPPAAVRLIAGLTVRVDWEAAERNSAKDPMHQVGTSTPPNEAIGFVAERLIGGGATRLPRIIAPLTQGRSKEDPRRVHRFFDRLAAPAAALRYRAAAFNSFGVLGAMSAPSLALTVVPARAVPRVGVLSFDNAPENGGKQSEAPPGWRGGTLHATVAFSGADLFNAPETRTVHLLVERLEPTREPLLTETFPVPAPRPLRARVTACQLPPPPDSAAAAQTQVVTLQTEPAFPAVSPEGTAGLLLFVKPAATKGELLITDAYEVRPQAVASGLPVVLRIPYADDAHGVHTIRRTPVAQTLTQNPNALKDQTVYFVPAFARELKLALPALFAPAESAQVLCRIAAQSDSPAFDPEQKDFPVSAKAIFSAPQRWTPPPPPTPAQAPSRFVHHERFDPPDFYGLARIGKLPFATPRPADGGNYLLLRAPAHKLFLADAKRRLQVKNFADPKPVLVEADGTPRRDLAEWIGLLPQWLTACNERRAALGLPPLTAAAVLSDAATQPSFIEHFYGGLLDDELRALADVPENGAAFTRVAAEPVAPRGTEPLNDIIEGQGFGRVLYKLQAAGKAATLSAATGAVGPYYTQPSAPPPSPVILNVAAAGPSLVITWPLSPDPEIAGYLLYRADRAESLADLRFFGVQPGPANPARPAALNYVPTAVPPLSFGAGETDPRLIALIGDPRLFAGDYEGSEMAEALLPAGVTPSEVTAVYRAAEFLADAPPEKQPQAFNYFRPPGKGGVARLVAAAGQARIVGLRLGFGRPVEVVVVAKVDGATRALGALAVRRGTFFDGGSAGRPADPHALPNWTPPLRTASNVYALVAVDRSGHRSPPSMPFVVAPF